MEDNSVCFGPAYSGCTEQTGERGLSGGAFRHVARPHGYGDVRVQFPSAHLTLQTITTSSALKKKRKGEERAREGRASSPVLNSNYAVPHCVFTLFYLCQYAREKHVTPFLCIMLK